MRANPGGRKLRAMPMPVLPLTEGAAMPSRTLRRSRARELAHRSADGLEVALLWHPRRDHVSVAVHDRRDGSELEFAVDPSRALDAFNHPFAYAP
jgi:hypothetical protein